MNKVLLAVAAASLIGTAALADETTTVVKERGVLGDTTTIRKERTDDPIVTRRSVETTGSLRGCETKSVTKSDEDGSTTKTKTEC